MVTFLASRTYWITVAVKAKGDADADSLAELFATGRDRRVISVEQEPPQGAMVVGDMHEDELIGDNNV